MSDELKYYSFKESELNTVIEKDFEFKGEAFFEHPILVKGLMEGSIKSKSDIYVGSSATVKCDVDSMILNIRGNYFGKAISRERLELLKGGRFEGDLECNDIIIQSGSLFNAKCKMPVFEEKNKNEI